MDPIATASEIKVTVIVKTSTLLLPVFYQREEVQSMAEFKIQRDVVLNYLKENGLSYADVGTAYKMPKQTVHDYLTGSKDTPKARQFIQVLIRDYGIRG